MPNAKENVDVYKLYGKDSILSKDEFMKEYKVEDKRTFK